MKTFFTLIYLALFCATVNSQTIPSLVPETNYSGVNQWTGWRHTVNNDVRTGGQYYTYFAVTVSDYLTTSNGTNPGFFWNASAYASGTMPLVNGASFPDISLMSNGNDIFVGIVYYKQNSNATGPKGYYFYSGKFDGIGNFLMNSPQLLDATSVSSSPYPYIHIDADNSGNFAITWVDSSNTIKVQPGMLMGVTPTLGSINSSIGLGHEPDVAVVNNNNSAYICLTHVNLARDQFVVNSTPFNINVGAWTNEYSSPSNATYVLPRIAAPASGNNKTFSVAVQRNFTLLGIARQNIELLYYNSTPSYTVLNDGSSFPLINLNEGQNTMPVLTYGDYDNKLAVQWFCHNNPLGVNYNLIGIDLNIPSMSLLNTGGYQEVNYGQTCCGVGSSSTPDNDGYGISGRFCNWARMNSFMDLNSSLGQNNLVWKLSSWSNSTPTELGGQYNTENKMKVFPSIFNRQLNLTANSGKKYYVKIVDQLGSTVLQADGTCDDINIELRNLDNLARGLYAFHVEESETNTTASFKVIKQ